MHRAPFDQACAEYHRIQVPAFWSHRGIRGSSRRIRCWAKSKWASPGLILTAGERRPGSPVSPGPSLRGSALERNSDVRYMEDRLSVQLTPEQHMVHGIRFGNSSTSRASELRISRQLRELIRPAYRWGDAPDQMWVWRLLLLNGNKWLTVVRPFMLQSPILLCRSGRHDADTSET